MRQFRIRYDFSSLYGEGSVVTVFASSRKKAEEKWWAEMDSYDRRAGAYIVDVQEV